MLLFKNYYQFVMKTGMLTTIEMFESLEIKPCHHVGYFNSERKLELLAFCKKHPDFHIISYFNANVNVNRYAPGGFFFFLADGDPNPHIMYDTTASADDLEVLELRAAQTAP